MSRVTLALLAVGVVVLSVGGFAYLRLKSSRHDNPEVRAALFAELKPVALRNCELKRYGGPADGGYLMCANFAQEAQSAYSYGIESEDNWGCQLSRETGVMVHQYDCFTPERPSCDGGRYTFHDECVGGKAETIDGNLFDSVAGQVAKNGDDGKRLIIKMDIEGAELDSLLAMPDDLLARVDQIPMELHGVDDPRYLELVRKLKSQFHLANLHFNNFACSSLAAPLPGRAYQVLWVNKRLADVDRGAPVPAPMHPANAPDNPKGPDCQVAP